MKLAKYGFITAFVIASLLGSGMLAFAEDGGEVDTDTIVKFSPSDEGGDIVDPTDPDKEIEPENPIDPNEPLPSGTDGPLSIDFAPILYFGNNIISGKDTVYNAKAQPVKDKGSEVVRYIPNYVQVTDNRGTLDGWILSVEQNGQLTSDSGRELTGAVITFENGALGSISDSDAPAFKGSFILDPDGSIEDVIVASENEGAGTWAYYFGDASNFIKNQDEDYMENDSITLFVPGSSVKLAETYSTSLTWTLSDVPGNEDGNDGDGGNGGEDGNGEEDGNGGEDGSE